MFSDRVQRQIDRLLDQAEEAIALRQWEDLRATCEVVLNLDPDHADAALYMVLVDKSLATDVVPDSSDVIEASPDETSLIDDQNDPALELIDFTENPENFNWLRKTSRGKKDDEGWTPLHLAARNNSFETSRLMIDRGANVDATDKRGMTPLHLAARYHHLDVASLLINRGANTENIDLSWMD